MFNSIYRVHCRLSDGSERVVDVFSESAEELYKPDCVNEYWDIENKKKIKSFEKAKVWLFNMCGETDPVFISSELLVS